MALQCSVNMVFGHPVSWVTMVELILSEGSVVIGKDISLLHNSVNLGTCHHRHEKSNIRASALQQHSTSASYGHAFRAAWKDDNENNYWLVAMPSVKSD